MGRIVLGALDKEGRKKSRIKKQHEEKKKYKGRGIERKIPELQ